LLQKPTNLTPNSGTPCVLRDCIGIHICEWRNITGKFVKLLCEFLTICNNIYSSCCCSITSSSSTTETVTYCEYPIYELSASISESLLYCGQSQQQQQQQQLSEQFGYVAVCVIHIGALSLQWSPLLTHLLFSAQWCISKCLVHAFEGGAPQQRSQLVSGLLTPLLSVQPTTTTTTTDVWRWYLIGAESFCHGFHSIAQPLFHSIAMSSQVCCKPIARIETRNDSTHY
jgi:hypothetical protein